jgi:hypothetical protein
LKHEKPLLGARKMKGHRTNTEQFVVEQIGPDHYENIHWGFQGNARQVREYAAAHNYGGGAVTPDRKKDGSILKDRYGIPVYSPV